MEILPRGSFADQMLRPWGQGQETDRTRAWLTSIVLGVMSFGLVQAGCGLYAGMRWLLGKQVSPAEPSQHEAITTPAKRALASVSKTGEAQPRPEVPTLRQAEKAALPEATSKDEEEELAESATSSQPPDIPEEVESPGPEREVPIAPPLPREELQESKREKSSPQVFAQVVSNLSALLPFFGGDARHPLHRDFIASLQMAVGVHSDTPEDLQRLFLHTKTEDLLHDTSLFTQLLQTAYHISLIAPFKERLLADGSAMIQGETLDEKVDHVQQYLKKHGSEITELHAFKMFCFPMELCQLTSLKKVVFSKGFIQTIPPAIRQLIKLTNLQMPSNGLSSVPDDLFQLKTLQFLDLSLNNLTTIPSGIDDLPNLMWFSFAGNTSRKFPDVQGFQQRSPGIYQRQKPVHLK